MAAGENIVERDILAWRKQEEQINKLFSLSVVESRDFQLEKLHQLDAIYYAYTRTQNPDERLTLRLLNMERKQLEKQLFPNFWQRLFREIRGNTQEMRTARRWEQQRAHNDQLLRDSVVKAGFGNINWQQFAQQVQRGQPSFTMQHTHYAGVDKRMEFDLTFSKDQKGLYQFNQYTAVLMPESKPDQARKQTFSVVPEAAINATQAANLLAGRSIRQDYVNAAGHKQAVWIKLDFNDRDNQGNFKRREFHSNMDITKSLKALPIQEKTSELSMEKLLQGLRNGDLQTVTLVKNGRTQQVNVAINPQLKMIDLINSHGKKISLAEALGEKKEKSQVVQLAGELQTTQSRKSGLTVK